MKFGDGGLEDFEIGRLREVAQQISDAERRAMAAERETADRLIAAHLADRVGATFTGRIAGVTRSGLFVKLKDTGADGFVPVSSLNNDFYNHVESHHALVGKRTGETFRLGDTVEVRLVEAIPSAGALRFEMLTEGKKSSIAAPHSGFRAKFRGRKRR
jgi:ribonuclease R